MTLLVEGFGASVTSRDCNYKTPLHYAAAGGHLPVVGYFLATAPDCVNFHKSNAWTPLMVGLLVT